MDRSRDALMVFAKYPRLGRVKTRLQDLLTARQCLDLYRALLADVLQRSEGLPVALHLFLAGCSPPQAGSLVASLGGDSGRWKVHLQEGEDLGERMENAYRRLSPRYWRLVFLGADSPDLPLDRLREAFRCLARLPVVIGPSSDGGYYLLGLAQARPALFRGIDWGSRRVLEQTLQRLDPGEVRLLQEWYDVDRSRDLRRLWRHLDPEQEGFPARTADFLRQCPQTGAFNEPQPEGAS
ncbi:MAG TPA: TIGR04282 family arsenosugar biosynthesis glycosyltransferase [Acidobacteriota bacterium]|nr:TIGR04282 family arsenosugar biosynthesis glycosyltransferase [Acidobacteriota bacterium]